MRENDILFTYNGPKTRISQLFTSYYVHSSPRNFLVLPSFFGFLDCQLEKVMRTHISSVHERKKPFSCKICDQSFSEKGSMSKQVASVHEGKKPFKCRMETHFSAVHEEIKSFVCKMCDKSFSEKGTLKNTFHQFMKEISHSNVNLY